jgi:hypothetical protein
VPIVDGSLLIIHGSFVMVMVHSKGLFKNNLVLLQSNHDATKRGLKT